MPVWEMLEVFQSTADGIAIILAAYGIVLAVVVVFRGLFRSLETMYRRKRHKIESSMAKRGLPPLPNQRVTA